MQYVKENDLGEIIQNLRRDYAGREEFVVGFSGYEPFVTANCVKPKMAALFPLFDNLAEEIKCQLRYRKTTWTKFSSQIEDHTIDTMLEPIIPTRQRAYLVIPYMQMTTNVLVVPERSYKIVEAIAEQVRKWTARVSEGSVDPDEYNIEVSIMLGVIAGYSHGTIGVTEGVVECDVLEEYGIYPRPMPPEDITQNIVKSIGDGTFFFADNRSARAAKKILYAENGVRTRIIHLFREKPPLAASCGFPVNKTNTALAKYFAYKCKFELSEIHDLLLREIPEAKFDGTDFRLLDSSEVPNFPITRYSHMHLMQTPEFRLLSGQNARLGGPSGPASQPLLEMGQQSEPTMAHCSVNIEGLSSPLSLKETLAITRDWDFTNKRRSELIERKMSRSITAQENEELRHLQKLAGAKRQLVMPLPIKELAEIEADLKRKGLFREE